MGYPRHSVDLSAYPDLVVIYLGYRASNLAGLRGLIRVGRGLRVIMRERPDGLLAHEGMWFGPTHPGFRQYWRDFESLEAFTRSPVHAEWWRAFARQAAGGGIWHETYHMRGGMEAIYSGVPGIGFAGFAPEMAPTHGLRTARQRVAASQAA